MNKQSIKPSDNTKESASDLGKKVFHVANRQGAAPVSNAAFPLFPSQVKVYGDKPDGKDCQKKGSDQNQAGWRRGAVGCAGHHCKMVKARTKFNIAAFWVGKEASTC